MISTHPEKLFLRIVQDVVLYIMSLKAVDTIGYYSK